MKKHTSRGFSLFELLLTLAIFVFLFVFALFSYRYQKSKAVDGKRKSDLHAIKIALEEYEKDNNCYPETLPSCTPGDGFKPYMDNLPCEYPSKTEGYYYHPDPEDLDCPRWYWVFSDLQIERDAQSVEIGCEFGCGPTAETAFFDYFESSPNAPAPVLLTSATVAPSPGIIPVQNLYGCIPNPSPLPGAQCLAIGWNTITNKPQCQPNYTFSDCAGKCDNPVNNCNAE